MPIERSGCDGELPFWPLGCSLFSPNQTFAQQNFVPPPPGLEQPEANPLGPLPDVNRMLSPQGLSSTLKLFLVLTVLSLAPSIFIMTTSFVRFVVVLGLLRQAMGTQQTPPNQVIVSLCLFLTFSVMSPVWKESYEAGIAPYLRGELQFAGETPDKALERAFKRSMEPIRRYMSAQIELTGNSDTVWMFIEYQRPAPGTPGAKTGPSRKAIKTLPSMCYCLPSY